jgi:hypothetical protein
MASNGMVIGPGLGARVRNPVGGEVTFKIQGDDSGGALTLFESVIAARRRSSTCWTATSASSSATPCTTHRSARRCSSPAQVGMEVVGPSLAQRDS